MAQTWEIGGGIGYGAYRNGSISSATATAEAGIRNKYAVTGVVTEDLFEHFSGEVRYVYHGGESFLQSGSAQGSVDALTHTITYDVLLHLAPRKSRIRPYATGGVGAKYFETTGTLPRPQPVPAIAGLTIQSQWKPAFDFGGGVKLRVTDHFLVRGDVRDYITPFPNKLFAPTGTAKQSGLLHQITPMLGIGYTF